MTTSPLVLVSRTRAANSPLLGSVTRLFQDHEIWTDDAGVVWATRRVGEHWFAVTWLGSGWVFDPLAAERYAERLAAQRRKMARADVARHQQELEIVVRQVRLGNHTERLLWSIQQALLSGKQSVFRLPDFLLAQTVWRMSRKPTHWRTELLHLLQGLTWLHVADGPSDEPPGFGRDSALLTHVADLRKTPAADRCSPECPGYGGPPHHHYLVNVGRGFLGVLEQFGQDSGTGVRSYEFPRGGPKSKGPCLWRVGKQGKLVSIFLPAVLGEPTICATFTRQQHRLLQALVREMTRAKKVRRTSLSEPEVFTGDLVPVFHGKGTKSCGLLDPAGQYVGFNGNGKRKGRGYLLATEGGWLAKAGYSLDDIEGFLGDLLALTESLGLIVVGVSQGNTHLSLSDMRKLARTASGRQTVQRLHVRVYTSANFLERWTAFFSCKNPVAGTTSTPAAPADAPATDTAVAALIAEMQRKKLSGRHLAQGLKRDHSFVAKALKGARPWPRGLLKKAEAWVAEQRESQRSTHRDKEKSRRQTGQEPAGSLLQVALGLLVQGWSVVPQLPGAKRPCVKWKPFQERLPTEEEWTRWARKWPNAGLALVLGPVSGIFVIDADGKDAHKVLIERLGREPKTPKVLSGSGDPHRYHLYFKHPQLPTKAKQTPWHPKLEFRGHRGIVIIPPSLHKSGNRYQWAPGRSPEDMDFPNVPTPVLEALKPIKRARPTPRCRHNKEAHSGHRRESPDPGLPVGEL